MTPTLADVAAYLAGTGWAVTDRSWRGARIWRRDDTEVLLPVRDDLGDNPARVRDVVHTVAALERRRPEDVERTIVGPDLDSVGLHATWDPGHGALPVGLQVIGGLRDLVVTAARTVVEGPHLRFRGAVPASVDAVLDKTLLALADGSHDQRCAVMLPVDAGAGSVTGRDVTVQLHDAVIALEGAVEREPEAVDATVVAGVSADLCLALSSLAGPTHDEPFRLVFGWAHRRSVGLAPREVVFGPRAGLLLRSAARRVGRLVVTGDAAVDGRVDGLHDEAGSSDRWRVKVRGALTGASPTPRGAIWVRLDDQRGYDHAVEAYRTGRRLRATGRLTSRNARVELATSRAGIEIVNEPEDDRA